MADSGVDSSNESSDNSLLEFRPPAQSDPPFQLAVPEHFDFMDAPSHHDHIGKLKYSTKMRDLRVKLRYGNYFRAKGHQLRTAASTNNTDAVERLLAAGVDPNSADEYERSPLHLAACRGYVEVVKLLLRHGADPNVKDSLGNTPLHLAACTSHIPIVIELLDAGTDVSSHDRHGRNPVQLAQSKLKLIQMRPSGAGRYEETRQVIGEICLIVEMMYKYMRLQKADPSDLEGVRKRLESLSTRRQVDSEVQNLLDSLDALNLR